MGMANCVWLNIRAKKYVYFNTFPPAPFLYVKRLAYWPFKDYKRQVNICNIRLFDENVVILNYEVEIEICYVKLSSCMLKISGKLFMTQAYLFND